MNILIVGLGSIAQKHIIALSTIQIPVNIYALRSKEGATQQKGITNIYALNNTSIKFDFAIISNPTYLHYSTIDILTDMSIPQFIEKPVLNSLNNAESLINKINNKKLETYVACNLRFHPCINFLKENLAGILTTINEVNIYCGSYLPDWRPEVDYKKAYSAHAEMGGGVHLDLFHELDYAVWLLGLPQKHSAVLKNNSSLNLESVDYANYILEYPNFAVSVILNYYRRTPKRTIEILFEHSTWVVNLITGEIIDDNNKLIFAVGNFKMADTYKLQLHYFINCLINRDPLMNTISESIDILKLCLVNDK